MSSITLQISLNYQSSEHASMVYSAFCCWPNNIQNAHVSLSKQFETIEIEMKSIGYSLPSIYEMVFEEETCSLDTPPEKEGNTVLLNFYCGRAAGEVFMKVFFEEFTALPVVIDMVSIDDFDDIVRTRCETIT